MNCGICRGGFSVNVNVKYFCVPVDKKTQKINSSCFPPCVGLNWRFVRSELIYTGIGSDVILV